MKRIFNFFHIIYGCFVVSWEDAHETGAADMNRMQ